MVTAWDIRGAVLFYNRAHWLKIKRMGSGFERNVEDK
jgi:hypothetical protein